MLMIKMFIKVNHLFRSNHDDCWQKMQYRCLIEEARKHVSMMYGVSRTALNDACGV